MTRTDGPLPTQDLEQAALELFTDTHPMILWAEPGMTAERNQARNAVWRVYLRVLTMERWTLANAAEKLTNQLCLLIFGDELCLLIFGDEQTNTGRLLQVQDFAEACLEDAVKTFAGDRSESWQHVPEDDDNSEIEVMPRRVN